MRQAVSKTLKKADSFIPSFLMHHGAVRPTAVQDLSPVSADGAFTMGRDFSRLALSSSEPTRCGFTPQRCPFGGACHTCPLQTQAPQSVGLQRKTAGNATLSEVPLIVHEVLQSPGQPLSQQTRALFEAPFGQDFGQVRVHSDARAADSAQAVHAVAYTVGQHVVFGSGQYSPAMPRGQRLLAHELAHTVQQRGITKPAHLHLPVSTSGDAGEQEAHRAEELVSGGATAGMQSLTPATEPCLMRIWDQPGPTDCSALDPNVWLEKVVVEQEQPQTVTLHWSDGHLNSSKCSTGKGHCCVDAASPEDAACSVRESRRDGSNCTPITEARGYPITDRYTSHNGWKFWSTFVPSRGIGLHQHPRVTGTPLSHGCVRLPEDEDTARLIFCGARRHQTHVQVRGFPRPMCADAHLQAEWRLDFESAAATVTDGGSSEARRIIGENRAEARRILRESYGRRLTEAEIGGGLDVLEIPRCTAQAALPTSEERRLFPTSVANAANPTVPVKLVVGAGFEPLLPAFTRALATARNLRRAKQIVRIHGRKLWQAATGRAQGADSDDRPTYWARLQMTRALRQWQPAFGLTDIQRTELLELFERASRGMETASFGREADVKRILISGFDPFGFPNPSGDIRQSNVSGAAALALDGQRLVQGGVSAQIEAVVFPVRYADFNRGMVESHLRPHLTGPRPPHLVMSISQGTQFELEEWAGRRRSTGTFRENLGLTSGTPTQPVEPPGLATGPEFLRHTVPSSMLGSMRGALGRTAATPGETTVLDLPQGAAQPRTSPAGPPPNAGLAVEGSGGGFLSNEIFYRNSLLRTTTGSDVPMIHLHTPRLKPTDGAALRSALVDTIRDILRATLPHL